MTALFFPVDLQFSKDAAIFPVKDILTFAGHGKTVLSTRKNILCYFKPRFFIVGLVMTGKFQRKGLLKGIAVYQGIVQSLGDAVRRAGLPPPLPEIIRFPGKTDDGSNRKISFRHGKLFGNAPADRNKIFFIPIGIGKNDGSIEKTHKKPLL